MRGNCATIELNGHTTGRVWIDRGTAAVLRMDERLTRRFSFLTPNARAHRGPIAQDVDRAEVSVRYEPVRFADPDETVMLPVSIRSLWVINNSRMPQLLTLHSYGAYRRFTTGGRVVK